MSLLITPCRDFNGTLWWGRDDDPGSASGHNDAKRPIAPGDREILAFEVRAGQQFRSGFGACAEYIADAAISAVSQPRQAAAPATSASAYAAPSKNVGTGTPVCPRRCRAAREIRQDPRAIKTAGDVRHELQIGRAIGTP